MRYVGNDMSFGPLVTVSEETPLIEAWRKMKDARVRHLPVLDSDKNPVGVLSDRDLWRAADAGVQHCREFADLSVAFDAGARVRDHMSRPARFVYANEDLKSVVRTLIDDKISSLLIKDPVTERLSGIITTEDLLRVLYQYLKKDAGDQDSRLRMSHAVHDSPVGWLANELSNTGI